MRLVSLTGTFALAAYNSEPYPIRNFYLDLMSPPKWATEVQLLWMRSFVPKFREHQAKGTVRAFWPFIRQKWFSTFPEWNIIFGPDRTPDSLTLQEKDQYAAAIEKRKKQVYNWFNNYQGDLGRKAMQVRPLSAWLLKMCMRPRGHRALQLCEFYSQKFYNSRVKWFVDAEIAACVARDEKPNTIAIIKRVTRERFESETDEFKDYVRAMWACNREELAIAAESDEEEPAPTPESYQESLDDLPAIVTQLLEVLVRRTGWTYMLACGGPQPSDGGALRCISMHAGPTGEGGCNYGDATPDFQKTTIKPLMNFIKDVYPQSVRDTRALGTVQPNHPGAMPPSEEHDEPDPEKDVPVDTSANTTSAPEVDPISEYHNDGGIFEGLLSIPENADIGCPAPVLTSINHPAMFNSAPGYPPSADLSSVHPPVDPALVTSDLHPQLMGARVVSSAASSVQGSVQQVTAINPTQLAPGIHLAQFGNPEATASSDLDLLSSDWESTFDFCDVDLDLDLTLDLDSYDTLSDFDDLMQTFSVHEGLLNEYQLSFAEVPLDEASIHPATYEPSTIAGPDALTHVDATSSTTQPSEGMHSQVLTQGRPKRNIRPPVRRDEEISLAPRARGSTKRMSDTDKENQFAGEHHRGAKRHKV